MLKYAGYGGREDQGPRYGAVPFDDHGRVKFYPPFERLTLKHVAHGGNRTGWHFILEPAADPHTVTNHTPQYLKLHVEDETLPMPPAVADIRGLDAVLHAFRELTGWQLRVASRVEAAAGNRWSMPLQSDGDDSLKQLELEAERAGAERTDAARTQAVAEGIGQLLNELQRTRRVVWQREAELAATIPVTLRAEEATHVALRLETVLRGGAEAIGCQAAALYLLDDSTTYLKLRSSWNLPKSRYTDPPRPLRGAVSDLEALVGHAVALEDTSLLPHWKAPETFPSALCVPVSTATTPLGTLWFFCDSRREFTDQQTNLAEIVAGRLVSDLERDVLASQHVEGRQRDDVIRHVARWQQDQRPVVAPLLDDWRVAGDTRRVDSVGGDFFEWSILPDGRLAVALGSASGPGVEAALTGVTVQTAMKSHAAYPHDARQLLERVNETLWTGGTGDRFASMFYATVDTARGAVEYAAAGHTFAVIVGQSGHEVLSREAVPLGADPDAHYRQLTAQIDPAETLVLFSRGVRESLTPDSKGVDELQIASLLRAHPLASAEEHVDALLKHARSGDELRDCSVLVVQRRR
jgi:serine phosphatase RsbU (regulator of sigma subunit)